MTTLTVAKILKLKKSSTALQILYDQEELLKRPRLTFLRDVVTRWNSTYAAIERMLQVGADVVEGFVLG